MNVSMREGSRGANLAGGAAGAGMARKESRRQFQMVDDAPRVSARRTSQFGATFAAPAQAELAFDKDRGRLANFDSVEETRDSLSAKISAAPVSGQQAVLREKKMAAMKTLAFDQKGSEVGVKAVEEKTFYLRNGYWTDSDYKNEKAEEVQFGSERYFALTRTLPNMSRYLALGKRVIVVIKGHAYKIVAPETT
jgi:hypothetical protein